jgi:hypothetical protein
MILEHARVDPWRWEYHRWGARRHHANPVIIIFPPVGKEADFMGPSLFCAIIVVGSLMHCARWTRKLPMLLEEQTAGDT